MDQVVVIDPHDSDDQKAQRVTHERRRDFPQRIESRLRWSVQLQNHDRNYDCDHAVAEGLEAARAHFAVWHRLEFITEGTEAQFTQVAAVSCSASRPGPR